MLQNLMIIHPMEQAHCPLLVTDTNGSAKQGPTEQKTRRRGPFHFLPLQRPRCLSKRELTKRASARARLRYTLLQRVQWPRAISACIATLCCSVLVAESLRRLM